LTGLRRFGPPRPACKGGQQDQESGGKRRTFGGFVGFCNDPPSTSEAVFRFTGWRRVYRKLYLQTFLCWPKASKPAGRDFPA